MNNKPLFTLGMVKVNGMMQKILYFIFYFFYIKEWTLYFARDRESEVKSKRGENCFNGAPYDIIFFAHIFCLFIIRLSYGGHDVCVYACCVCAPYICVSDAGAFEFFLSSNQI